MIRQSSSPHNNNNDIESGGSHNNKSGDIVQPSSSSSSSSSSSGFITIPPPDPVNHLYPYCLVWGPLPVISWCCPCIGHAGITDSEGKIHDFAGPYYISIDSFMVSETKYAPVNPNALELDQTRNRLHQSKATRVSQQDWDSAVIVADKSYRKQMHNICCNNCHHHAADALANMGLRPNTMLGVWWYLIQHGKYTSTGAIVQTYLPFFILLVVATIIALATGPVGF